MKSIDLIKPDIYDDFQCKGAACRRTCCAGWKITLSKSEYQDLKEKLKHPAVKLVQRLPAESRSPQIYGEFILDGISGCGLQTAEKLCGLQLSFGADALPNVCASFPRKVLRYKDQAQLCLTPACERVLELLLEKDASLGFLREKKPLPHIVASIFSGKNADTAWKHYIQLQEFCILLLQAPDVSLDTRMALLGSGLHQINKYYIKGEGYKAANYMDQYLDILSKLEDTEHVVALEESNASFLIGTFFSAVPFSSEYAEIIEKVKAELEMTSHIDSNTGKTVFSYSTKRYERCKKKFKGFTDQHPFFLENIMVMLFIMEHWCSLPYSPQSIWEQYMYACWVYSNLKLTLASCIESVSSDEELLDICVNLFRNWIHGNLTSKASIKHFHDTGCDTPAHMAMLVQAG